MAVNYDNFVSSVKGKYDDRLLEKRLTTEGNVCGCLLKNLELFDDCGLDTPDFITNGGRLLFTIAKQLRSKGIQKFDEVTFVSTLESEFVRMVENQLGGYKEITNVMDAVNENNWDAFLDEFNKSNVLLKLSDKGFGIFSKIVLDNGKEMVPFEFFKNLTCTEVIEFYEGIVASMQTTLKDEKLLEECYVEFDDAWIESLRNKEEMGVSFGEAGFDIEGEEIRTFPFMSANTLGLKPGTLSAWGANSGCGKALPNNTIIPTPIGPRRVGDIRPGDYLFGQNGKPTKVLMIHPQSEPKEIWKVHFKDGRMVECCKDHLWEYRYSGHKGFNYRVETIEQLYNRCGGEVQRGKFEFKYAIKLNKAVEYPQKEYSVDPYVMGALLGNGYFSSRAIQFSSGTKELPDLLSSVLKDIVCTKSKIVNSKNYTYDFRPIDNPNRRIKTQVLLKDYPELWETRSHTKFIPEEYLYGSIEQRISLLQGLLDTDGSVDAKGRIRFSTTSPKLKDGFVELCRSLGYIATVRVDNRIRYKSGVCYNIGLLTPKSEKPNLFRLTSKKQKAIEYSSIAQRTEFNDHLAIVKIEKTNEKTDMTCFTVDSPDHLFLANDYVVTHNTTYMVTIAMSLASKGEKVVMVTNESKATDLKTLFLTWVINRVFKYEKLSKKRIIAGEFTNEEFELIKKAKEYWKEHYFKKIKIVTLSDADADFSCQMIRRAILREAASVFIVDTMKMTLSDDMADKSWIALIKDVRSLTELAMKYNVIGIITVQLAPSTLNRSWLDASCLANCKQIKETLSNLILFRKLVKAELDPNSPFFVHPFRRKLREDGSGEWYDEPYEADKEKTWIIAFTDKTRRGIDSGMDGSAFLCRTDLDHASFYETARCYPTRRLFTADDRH